MCLERIKGPTELNGATVSFQDCKMAFDNAEKHLRHTFVDSHSAVQLDILRDFCVDLITYLEGSPEDKVRSTLVSVSVAPLQAFMLCPEPYWRSTHSSKGAVSFVLDHSLSTMCSTFFLCF